MLSAVPLTGLKGKKEWNGREGVLGAFDAARGRFAVTLDGERAPGMLRPANLRVAPPRPARAPRDAAPGPGPGLLAADFPRDGRGGVRDAAAALENPTLGRAALRHPARRPPTRPHAGGQQDMLGLSPQEKHARAALRDATDALAAETARANALSARPTLARPTAAHGTRA